MTTTSRQAPLPFKVMPIRGGVTAGTGHRPPKLGGYSPGVRGALYRMARQWLEAEQPGCVISGMALGWDQALAQASYDVGIPWHAYIPFEGQEKAWPETSQATYHELLRHAARKVYTSAPGYAAWKMQRRNEAMVDACTHVLALWDGSEGGTHNCVKYAELKGKPIINLWETWRLQR